MLTCLDHVVVLVRELDAATLTYERLLGRAPSWRGDHASFGTRNAMFRFENTALELLAPQATSEAPIAKQLSARLDEAGEGPLGLAFGTDDATKCAAWMRERGLEVADPISGEAQDAQGAKRNFQNVFLSPSSSRGPVVFAVEYDEASAELAMRAGDASSVSALDHVVIQSPDVEATRALYGDGLGLRLALDREFEKRGVRLLFFRIAGVTVEIAGRLSPIADRTLGPEKQDDFFWGISWRVRDIDAARARVEASGFQVSDLRKGLKPGTRVCTVREPTHGVATLLLATEDGR